ncbi:hypothetical protein ACTUSX_04195 [Pantoea ananatis]|uniref:hypothetical protein n=1 Tax=Pantoea ananas TaxID=553 RepID=UPI003FA46443
MTVSKEIQIFNAEPDTNYFTSRESKKSVFIAEQHPDGSVRFISAGMLFDDPKADTIDTETKTQNKEAGVSSNFTKSALTWAVTVLPLGVAIVTATIWVTSSIESKARENRLEMKQDLSDMQKDFKADMIAFKQDITSQNNRLQDSIQRVSDRTDTKLDTLSNQLKDMQNNTKK